MARGRGGGGGRGRGDKGKGKGKDKGKVKGGGGGGGGRLYQDNRVSFDKLPKTNEKFERFYNTLNLIPQGEERDAFWAALRRELPNSFRFTGSKAHALEVCNQFVERFFPIISQIEHEGKPVEIPKTIPWYPEGLAFTMTTPKNVIRKYGPFKEFQKFLVSETGVGNISRQEQVSMIPPLLLDVKPEHTVLDLCAAPGSKSAQLIELLHAGEEDRVKRAAQRAKDFHQGFDGLIDLDTGDGGRTPGLLVANDVNYQRAQMLVHQVKRLNSPNLIVTNHDATMFPSIELPTAPGQPRRGKYLKFDRILADVPCSGDGTVRKSPNVWKDWSPQNAIGLYITQVRILVRALQMLKVGGKVVYSTCSMNPVENEAIVASAIERCGGTGKVKLLDTSDQLRGLIRSPGLTDWSIMNRNGAIYESWAEAKQYELENAKIVPGMFAPEAIEEIPLQHCTRVYPHQQDSGGFFIAVLEKLSEIAAKPEIKSKCSKKDWVFGEMVEEAQLTDFGELLDDVATAPADANGHLFNPSPDPGALTGTNGDVSAAARQNADDLDNGSPSLKRKFSEELADGEMALKKPKFGDEPADLTSTSNTTRKEHAPVPPAVAMAVEAADAEPAGETVDDEGADYDMNMTADDADVTVPAHSEANDPSATLEPPRKRRRVNEEPALESFKYLAPDHEQLKSIDKFFGLSFKFPRDRFLVRNPAGDPVKGIYYSSQLVKDILIANEDRKMKFVHAGVKMFMKQDVQGHEKVCPWRIQTEGLPILESWVDDRRLVRLNNRNTLRTLLVEMFPRIGGQHEEVGQGWRGLGEVGPQVRVMGMGCCVLRGRVSISPDGSEEQIVLPLWRSQDSLNLMLPKEERKAMLLRIFNEEVELVNHSDRGKNGHNGKGKGKGEPKSLFKSEPKNEHKDETMNESKDAFTNEAEAEPKDEAKDEVEDESGNEHKEMTMNEPKDELTNGPTDEARVQPVVELQAERKDEPTGSTA